MLARLKERAADPGSAAGAAWRQAFRPAGQRPAGRLAPPLTGGQDFAPADLPQTNALAGLNLGPGARVEGTARFVFLHKTATLPFSLGGYLELTCRVAAARGAARTLTLRERREIRAADLRDLFFDKYALYLKSFCPRLNDPDHRIVIEGVVRDDVHSRVYLGNRFYPAVPEFPQGERGGASPPVLLDLDFLADRALIENLGPGPTGMAPRDARAARLSQGQVFLARSPALPFKALKGRHPLRDFALLPALTAFYRQVIVDKARPFSASPDTVGYEVMQDFQHSGGNPEVSQVFRLLVDHCIDSWQYHYGYTDYQHIRPPRSDRLSPFIAEVPHFAGIQNYFLEQAKRNLHRVAGGAMPLLFGPGRDIPVYVEGNVFLRFFKVAFLDEFSLTLPFKRAAATLRFPVIPLPWIPPDDPQVFLPNRNVGVIDGIEEVLMSRAVDHLSINTFFFDETEPCPIPRQAGTTADGASLFPLLDPGLHNVSHFYATVGEFLEARTRQLGGESRLSLDGIMVIHGIDGAPLDLTPFRTFTGQGIIVLQRGGCHLASLRKTDPRRDRLKIQLLGGSFSLAGRGEPCRIEASLAATAFVPPDPARLPRDQQLTVLFDGGDVEILGNLVVDDLDLARGRTGAKTLRLIHDPDLFLPADPYRLSISPVRTLYAAEAGG